MTIKPSNAYQTYICTGGEREFPFSFPVYAEHHLIVEVIVPNGTKTRLTYLKDYNITGIGNETGGCVILKYPALAGERFTLLLAVPEERLNDYAVNRPVSPGLLNKELDILVQCLQRMRRDIDRCPNIELGQTWEELLASIYQARNQAQQSEINISNTENACNQIKDQMGQMNAEALAANQQQVALATQQANNANTYARQAEAATSSKANRTMDNLPNGYDCIVEAWPTLADIQAGRADGSKWYEIYKSGKKRMGGRLTINADGLVWVSFPKAFQYAPINVFTHPYNQPTNSTGDHNFLTFPLAISNTGFNFKYFDSDGSSWRRGTVSWEAVGF